MVSAFVIFLAGGDDEITVFDMDVFAAVCVGLELVVAPAGAAEVVGPFFRVGGGTVGTVEFVGPGQDEIFWSSGLRGFCSS